MNNCRRASNEQGPDIPHGHRERVGLKLVKII